MIGLRKMGFTLLGIFGVGCFSLLTLGETIGLFVEAGPTELSSGRVGVVWKNYMLDWRMAAWILPVLALPALSGIVCLVISKRRPR